MNDFQVYLKEKTDFFETELQKNISGRTCLSVHLCVLADV